MRCEAGQFWFRLLKKQDRVARAVLEAARHDMTKAEQIAEQGQSLPIGRFLIAPLKLRQPTPETFRLALEAAADKEFIEMRRGNKLLELTATVAPLFGLLGMAVAVFAVFSNPQAGNAVGTNSPNLMQAIGHGLIPVAASLYIEIIAFTLLRISSMLHTQQVEYFSEVGNKLELYYREFWQAAQRNERLKGLAEDNRYSSIKSY